MWKPFSKREFTSATALRHDVPKHVRKRLLFIIQQFCDNSTALSFSNFLHGLAKILLQQYGELQVAPFSGLSYDANPAVAHFMHCDDPMALDCIEFCFHVSPYVLGQHGVEAVNRIFFDEQIGYEMTSFREILTDEPSDSHCPGTGGRLVGYEFPQFIRKDSQFIHQEIIQPCLDALNNALLRTAESEMRKAHVDYDNGRFPDAITSCCSAFESVLKTICDHRGWQYDPDKDTCARLIKICKDNGLFPPFYSAIFEGTGIIRNKLGDAHGRGPNPLHQAAQEQAAHMIQMTSAHITLLVSLARL